MSENQRKSGMDDPVIQLLIRRMDVQDETTKSINENLAGIKELLGKLALHEHRLDEHRDSLDDHEKRIDSIESTRDKNESVMKVLNRILLVGIPSMVGSILIMAVLSWYGMSQKKEISAQEIGEQIIKQIEKRSFKKGS